MSAFRGACSPDEAQRNPGMFAPGVGFVRSARVAPDWHPGYGVDVCVPGACSPDEA